MLLVYFLGVLVVLAAGGRALFKALGRLASRDDCIECGHYTPLHDPIQGCIADAGSGGGLACGCRFEI